MWKETTKISMDAELTNIDEPLISRMNAGFAHSLAHSWPIPLKFETGMMRTSSTVELILLSSSLVTYDISMSQWLLAAGTVLKSAPILRGVRNMSGAGRQNGGVLPSLDGLTSFQNTKKV